MGDHESYIRKFWDERDNLLQIARSSNNTGYIAVVGSSQSASVLLNQDQARELIKDLQICFNIKPGE